MTGLHRGHFRDIVGLVQNLDKSWEQSQLDDEVLVLRHPLRNQKTLRDVYEFIYVHSTGEVTIGDWMEDAEGIWQWYPHQFTKDSYDVLNTVLRVATNWDIP